MGNTTCTPKRTGLLDMLGSAAGSQFVIPVYQRNYTWKADNEVKQYLSDLDGVLTNKFKNHFLGILIYLEKPIDFSSREMLIIDGQQRLTTTFLILYAVREIYKENGEEDRAKQLENQYLTNPFHIDKVKYKLKPLVSDDDVYRCIVEDRIGDIDNPQSNVIKNYNYVREHINKLISSGYELNDVLMALNKLYVICVPIDEDDNAQKIFESINATGAKLTSADLIRNFLLMDLKSDTQEKFYKKYWRKIEENVSEDSRELETFFRIYLAIKTYTLAAKSNLYREFEEWIYANKCDTEEVFIELLEYAKVYHAVNSLSLKQLDPKFKMALTDFRKINSDIPMVLVLVFYKLYADNKIDADAFAQSLESVNAFMLRRSLCDFNSKNITKLFPATLKKTLEYCNGNYSNIVRVLNQEMVGNNAGTSGSFMPTDEQMHDLLSGANVYGRPALRIILDRLELENNSAPVDLSSLSIEHLMPQSPTDEWLEELGVDEDEYMENLHRLGNLTLASKPDNSKMKNLLWNYKNEVIKKTAHLTLNLELLGIRRWNISEIEKRTDSLIDRICKLYPYPDVTISKSESIGTVTNDKAIEHCLEALKKEDDVTALEMKGRGKKKYYKSNDGDRAYIISTSKLYEQGNKEKYWFAFDERKFDVFPETAEGFMIYGCRNTDTTVVKLSKEFLLSVSKSLNVSADENGDVDHYHIVMFKYPDGKLTLLLSHSKNDTEEIDISKCCINNTVKSITTIKKGF